MHQKDPKNKKITAFAGCVWRTEVRNGSVLVPKPVFDGTLLVVSLPHLYNLHFWASFRKHKKPRGLGKGGDDFTDIVPKHCNKAQSRSRLTKCSPEADLLENHT